MTRILGIDAGSRWCGAAAVESERLIAAGTFDVNPGKVKPRRVDVEPVVTWILVCAAWSGAERIVVEHSEEWAPWPGMAPAAQKATQANWTVCDRIVRALEARASNPVEIMHANTWRARVVGAMPKDQRDAHPKMDGRVAAAMPCFFHAADLAVLGTICPPCTSAVHQRDAAGVAIGSLLTPPPKEARPPREPRPKGPRAASRNAGWLARRSAAREQVRAAAGCTCGRTHRRGCPLDRRPRDYRCHGTGPDGVDPLDVALGLA